MTVTVIDTIAPRNFNNGTVLRPASPRQVPNNFSSVIIQLQPTTGNPATPFQGIANPWSNPATTVTFGVKWSWDSGATFPESTESSLAGDTDGQWPSAKGTTMTPQVELGLPFNSNLGGKPNFYQGYATLVNGPIFTGIIISEVTTP